MPTFRYLITAFILFSLSMPVAQAQAPDAQAQAPDAQAQAPNAQAQAPNAQAQAPNAQAQAPNAQAQAPNAQAQAPVPSVDLTLLKQALAPLASAGLLQSHSTLQMSGSKQGISFTFHEQVSAVAKRPGKFRAEITQYAANDSPQSRLLVVSDGLKVWTYRPDVRQYSIKSAKAFHEANDDMTATGLAMGGFFLGEGHDLAQGLQGITKQTNAQALKTLSDLGITVSERTEGIDGEDDYVYRLTLGKQGTAYRFAISPETLTLRGMELTGRQNGVTMTLHETITALSKPTTIAKTAFHFTPPAGASRVATLSANPF